ncbi:FMN-binding protein [Herbiconiux sp. SYSU D00978]|uniref:FMN-binding protein n=1 Tax=Herbiconiux sp. SYSU D00978 TaxID=2812562 RepID=UPI001A95D568|nr:FMN-binding protein [Herbiconiux sp. SYSU D00978]
MRRRAAIAGAVTSAGVLAVGWVAGQAAVAEPVAVAEPADDAPDAGGADGVYTGDAVDTLYGTVQVEITVAGGELTDVEVLQQTNSGSRSDQINGRALPQLTEEALAAQSADIDAASGATYSSQGYLTSLQSAIDAAGL